MGIVDVILSFFQEEVLLAVGLQEFVEILRSGDLARLWSFEGATALVVFIVPALLFLEVTATAVQGTFRWQHYRMQALIYITSRVFARTLSIGIGLAIITWVRPYRLIDTSPTWYWFIYAYLVFEFSHFIYHWTCHRVRILWCLHATHHAPPHMNLSVSYAHFFLEAPYADIVRLGICTLAGVDPLLLLVVLGIDSIWGHVIHVGEELVPKGRMGILGKFILTPSHHRVHHSRNPEYIDKNYCNLLPLWDRLFGTYQDELADKRPIYGVSREIDTDSLTDMYFGEIAALFRDMKRISGVKNKLAYLVMPPGWHPASVLAQWQPEEEAQGHRNRE
ncbi:MAG: sterol desaturase family protein [Halioglobus sp.]